MSIASEITPTFRRSQQLAYPAEHDNPAGLYLLNAEILIRWRPGNIV